MGTHTMPRERSCRHRACELLGFFEHRSSLEPPNVANTVFERYCLSLSHGVDVGQIKLRPNKESISAVVDPLTSSSEKVVVDKHSNADEFRFR